MVKRTIIIHQGNKDDVFSFFARTLTFTQYDKLPTEVKDEYLTWSMETFLKERQLLLEQQMSLKQRQKEEKKKRMNNLELSQLETASKSWFSKAKFSLLKKSHV